MAVGDHPSVYLRHPGPADRRPPVPPRGRLATSTTSRCRARCGRCSFAPSSRMRWSTPWRAWTIARAMPGVVGGVRRRATSICRTSSRRVPSRCPAAISTVRSNGRSSPAERLRYVGEPYAVVVAATHGAGARRRRGDPRRRRAAAGGDRLRRWPRPTMACCSPRRGTNIATRFEQRWDDDVLAGAEVTVRGRFVNQRVAPVPMEMNAIAVIPEAGRAHTRSGSRRRCRSTCVATSWTSSGSTAAQIRVIAPDVGGGFGAKVPTYPEYLVVAKAAQVLGRPVRWAESRSESMVSMTHGRSQVQWIELGARRDGHDHGAALRGPCERRRLSAARVVHGRDHRRDDLRRLRDRRRSRSAAGRW